MKDSELALLDYVPVPLFVLEASGDGDITYSFFNKSANEISKFNLDDYIGLNATHLYHGEYGEFAYEKHLECCLSAQPCSYILPLPLNGKLRFLKTRLMPMLDRDGLVTRIVGVSTQVTEEHDLQEALEQYRSVETEHQEFIYLAAHDLRSPMRKVHMFADMLREDFKDMGDGKLDLIDMLEQVSIASMSMIQTVLKHAETTAIVESVEDISLQDICSDILVTLDPTRLHKSIVEKCSIHADRRLMQTILRNLIDNAFKHNAPESIVLEISAKTAKAGYFSLTVVDNGRGMNKPEKLFKVVDDDRSKSSFGLLAIRELIRKSGGDVLAENPVDGTGLVVTVILPGHIN